MWAAPMSRVIADLYQGTAAYPCDVQTIVRNHPRAPIGQSVPVAAAE
jgi:hypothetical protein